VYTKLGEIKAKFKVQAGNT